MEEEEGEKKGKEEVGDLRHKYLKKQRAREGKKLKTINSDPRNSEKSKSRNDTNVYHNQMA